MPTVPALKKAVARRIRGYAEQGGFLFAMCLATETLELALAARDVDIAASFADGTPMDPDATARLQALGFRVSAGQAFSPQPSGTVSDQTPAPGTVAPTNSIVTISVSKGNAPVRVPSVVGATQANAIASLQQAGFVPVVATETVDSASQGGLVQTAA